MDTAEFKKRLVARAAGLGLAFPMAEYEGRIARVRSAMAEQGLDALLVTHSCDLNYLAGYETFGVGNHACLVLPLDGAPSLQVVSIEVPAAVVNGWVEDLVVVDWHLQGDAGAHLAGNVREKGLGRGRVGIQPVRQGLSPHVCARLEEGLPGVELVDASGLVARIRLVKSAREIACMRATAGYTHAGIRASLAVIAPGITDNDVARAGYDAMAAAGSEFMAIQPIVTSGVRTSFGHQTFRRMPLAAGDVVFLEYGGSHKRYTAPIMRTATLGEPTDDMRRLMDAVHATVDAMMETARPGRTCHEVALAAKRAHAPVADETYHSGAFGYHVGIAFPPTWAEGLAFIAEGTEEPLAAGMTLHLPITYRIPGAFGMAASETVLITDRGCERLTDLPRDIHVVAA